MSVIYSPSLPHRRLFTPFQSLFQSEDWSQKTLGLHVDIQGTSMPKRQTPGSLPTTLLT